MALGLALGLGILILLIIIAFRLGAQRSQGEVKEALGSTTTVEPSTHSQPSGAEEKPDALRVRGDRSFDSSQWAEARDAYRKYLESDPLNTDVISDLGICYQKLREFELANQEFDRALQINPQKWQALYNKIVLFTFDLKRVPEAKALLPRLRTLQTNNPEVEKLVDAVEKADTAPSSTSSAP